MAHAHQLDENVPQRLVGGGVILLQLLHKRIVGGRIPQLRQRLIELLQSLLVCKGRVILIDQIIFLPLEIKERLRINIVLAVIIQKALAEIHVQGVFDLGRGAGGEHLVELRAEGDDRV